MGTNSKKLRKSMETSSESEEFDFMEGEEHMVDGEKDRDQDIYDDEDGSCSEQEEDDDEEDGNEQNGGNRKSADMEEAEMEELEEQYKALQDQSLLKIIKHHKDEDMLKGQAVKNQKALWEKALEFRFSLQKAFTSSNRLPQEPTRSAFCDSNEGVNSAYSELVTSAKQTLKSLLELQEAVIEKNPSICQSSNGNLDKSIENHSEDSNNADDEEWLQVSQMHQRISTFKNNSIDKWQSKTEATTRVTSVKSKLHAFNQPISQQIASYMRDPSKRIKQMQQTRSVVGVFGTVNENKDKEDDTGDGDPEIIDDSDFYQQLLKEFLETVDPTSSEALLYEGKKTQTKKRKKFDKHATKSRKIRYHVHEKIVNFMAPRPMNLPPVATQLFQNLFGSKAQKLAYAA